MLVLVDHINVLFFTLFTWVVVFNFKLDMEQYFENENTYDVFTNEVRMEDEPLQELEKIQKKSKQKVVKIQKILKRKWKKI